jgi:hypothetical protein
MNNHHIKREMNQYLKEVESYTLEEHRLGAYCADKILANLHKNKSRLEISEEYIMLVQEVKANHTSFLNN